MSEKKVEENEAVEIEECKDLGEFIHSVIKEIYKRFKDPQNVTIQFKALDYLERYVELLEKEE